MSIHAPEAAAKILLDEREMPKRWYNIQADLPFPGSPPLHPGTKQPIGPQDLAPLFPMELIKQEVSQERYIDIPSPVQDALRLWRPTPLMLHRDRGRAVGERAGVCEPAVRPRMHDLHGSHQLRAEALPQEHDARLGRRGCPEPF